MTPLEYDAARIWHPYAALGRAPLREEAAALALCAPEFYVIGDCVVPATIYQATSAAYFAALDVMNALRVAMVCGWRDRDAAHALSLSLRRI